MPVDASGPPAAPHPRPAPGSRTGESQAFAMSPAQQRMWIAHHVAPQLGHCNVQRVLRLEGALDVPRLERCLNALVRRHGSLRTGFPEAGDIQVVHGAASLRLPTADLADLDGVEREAALRRRVIDDARRPFDLARPPLLRACVLRFGPDDHALILTVHNIVCDGWSLGLLFRELAAAYAHGTGETVPLPAPAIQYADCAEWSGRERDDGAAERSLAYWRQRLAGATPSPWPAAPGATATDLDGARRIALVEPDLTGAVSSVARREHVTPFAIFLAALLVMLRGASGQDDLLVGTPIAGRRHVETRSVVGLFVDMLAIRADLAGHPSFAGLVRRIHAAVARDFEHLDVSFQRLVEALAPASTACGQPYFDVVINYTGDRQRIPARWGTLRVEPVDVDAALSRCALTLFVRDDAPFKLELVHRTAVLDVASAGAFLDDYLTLLRRACDEPHRTIDELTPPARPSGGPAAPS